MTKRSPKALVDLSVRTLRKLRSIDVQQTLATQTNEGAPGLSFSETRETDAYTVSYTVEDGIERVAYEPKDRRFETPILMQHGMRHGAWCWQHRQALFAEWGWASTALYLLPIALLSHRLAAASGIVGTLACANLTRTAIITLQQESVKARWRSTMSGTATMAAGLGFAAAALGGGYLVPAFGCRGLFLLGAGISFVGILVF